MHDLLVYTTIDIKLFTLDQQQRLLWQEAVYRCAVCLQAGVVTAQTAPGPVSQTPAPSDALVNEVVIQPSAQSAAVKCLGCNLCSNMNAFLSLNAGSPT